MLNGCYRDNKYCFGNFTAGAVLFDKLREPPARQVAPRRIQPRRTPEFDRITRKKRKSKIFTGNTGCAEPECRPRLPVKQRKSNLTGNTGCAKP